MKVRHPPGRAGRPWLIQRLAAARRGAELLGAKHRALTVEHRRLVPLAAEARGEWESAAREAERALTRAAMLGGERQLDIARRAGHDAHAEVTVHWRTVLGVTRPDEAQVHLGALPEPSALGASAALLAARECHHRALEAAVRCATLAGALWRLERELEATARRQNAVERRWIPSHAQALAELELSLDELERADATRVRWAVEHAGQD